LDSKPLTILGSQKHNNHGHAQPNFIVFIFSPENISLKFKYSFDEATSKINSEDEYGPASKKIKLNNNKKTSIIDYSLIQLPVASFIEYLESGHLNTYLDKCLKRDKPV
jgi:hypothetical protein